jgi:hypothetical protein
MHITQQLTTQKLWSWAVETDKFTEALKPYMLARPSARNLTSGTRYKSCNRHIQGYFVAHTMGMICASRRIYNVTSKPLSVQ